MPWASPRWHPPGPTTSTRSWIGSSFSRSPASALARPFLVHGQHSRLLQPSLVLIMILVTVVLVVGIREAPWPTPRWYDQVVRRAVRDRRRLGLRAIAAIGRASPGPRGRCRRKRSSSPRGDKYPMPYGTWSGPPDYKGLIPAEMKKQLVKADDDTGRRREHRTGGRQLPHPASAGGVGRLQQEADFGGIAQAELQTCQSGSRPTCRKRPRSGRLLRTSSPKVEGRNRRPKPNRGACWAARTESLAGAHR